MNILNDLITESNFETYMYELSLHRKNRKLINLKNFKRGFKDNLGNEVSSEFRADGFMSTAITGSDGKPDVQRFHGVLSPDNINVNKFWETCMKYFPELAINGDTRYNSKNNCNISSQGTMRWFQILSTVDKYYQNYGADKFKILEIGVGFGSLFKYIKKRYGTVENYHCLDVVKHFEHNNFHIGTGHELPLELHDTKFDLIVSNNCFQHLSFRQQRTYLSDCSKLLMKNRKLIFNVVIQHPYSPPDSNATIKFFNQLLPSYRMEDYEPIIKMCGFKIYHTKGMNIDNKYAWMTYFLVRI